MRIAYLTEDKSTPYVVIDISVEEFQNLQEQYYSELYQRYKQELAKRHEQKQKSQEDFA